MPLTFNKFNNFVQALGQGQVNLNSDSLYILLTNTAPAAGDTVVDTTTSTCTVKASSNAAEIAAGNGYVKGGGQVSANAFSQSAGLASLTGNDVVVTASGGSIGPFRYAVLFDASAGTSSTRPVLGWWDYGSSVTLGAGSSVTLQNSNGSGNFTSTYPVLTLQ